MIKKILVAFDDSFASEAVHDRHDRGVGARKALRQAVPNVANGALAHRPKSVHTIQFQRGKVQKRPARRTRFSDCLI